MSFTDEIKKIGENISSSYDARIGTLEDIFKDTQSTLKDARATVKNFHGERMHMSEELRSELSSFTKELSSTTKKLLDDANKMMNEIAGEHKEMARMLREDLDKFHHAMYRETHTMLKEFRTSFEKMSQELNSMLSSYYKGEIQKPVQSMLNTYHSQMKALGNDFHNAHNAWVSLSRSLNAKRGMKQSPAKIASKKEQICSILQAHPEGMSMGMIGKEMDCSSQSIRGPINNLKKDGQVSKRKNKFFFKG